MIVLGLMLVVYLVCCFGEMRKPAIVYLIATTINIPLYFIALSFDGTSNRGLIDLVYMYGISEVFLKAVIVMAVTRLKYKTLYILALMHIANDAFNIFYYELVNNAIIACEMLYSVVGSKSAFSRITHKLSTRDLWHIRHSGGV